MQKFTLQFCYGFLVKWFLKIIVGVRFDKATFLKNEKQFVIVANHNSHLDTMTLMASMPGNLIHKIKPVAAADHFGKNKLQGVLSRFFVNALLIPRKRNKEQPEKDPINIMLKALDEGYSLIIFPEGTRGEPEVPQNIKPGIGLLLSQRPHIKYVPAFMKGMGKAMPKGDNLIVPFNSKLKFGTPAIINSPNVDDILRQIEDDLNKLKSII